MTERNSGLDRAAHDWYVEPSWLVELVADRVPELLWRPVHDPCCGSGTIPDTLIRLGGKATGADIVDRTSGRFLVQDFLQDGNSYESIFTNPPFNKAKEIVEHAILRTRPGGIVAIVAQAKFLYSQGRYPLFTRPEIERVLHFSRRPSMPPGELLEQHGEDIRGGGSMDYSIVLWRAGQRHPRAATVDWLI